MKSDKSNYLFLRPLGYFCGFFYFLFYQSSGWSKAIH